jgi:hypothetical protein
VATSGNHRGKGVSTVTLFAIARLPNLFDDDENGSDGQ